MMKLHLRCTGFSLLEMALTLGIAGTVLSGIWQLMGTTGQTREAAVVASQTQALAGASAQYIAAQRSVLLAMPALAAFDGSAVIRVNIEDGDGGDTATSVIGLGYLPSAFVNRNSYGQTYNLYVRREDGGAAGADANDTLVGLLVSTGGVAISDTMGARIAGLLGAAGGFFYASDNPASPATLARGTTDGWQIDLTGLGWTYVNTGGTVTAAGHLAVLTNLAAPNVSGSGGGGAAGSGGGGSIDELSDGATDYTTRFNVYLGQGVAENDTVGGYNTAAGYEALKLPVPPTINGRNTALGQGALRGNSGAPTGTNNIGLGYYAGGYISSGSYNVAIGSYADRDHQNNSNRVAVGSLAGVSSSGESTTFIGSYAGASLASYPGATGSTVVGAHSGRYSMGAYNTLVGAYIGVQVPSTGAYNTAMGYEALNYVSSSGVRNTVIGYRSGYTIGTGTDNIMLGNNTSPPNPTDNYRLNIGNYIYGNINTQQLNIGSPTLVTGLAFDVGRTDSARLPTGNRAQRPTCALALQGAQRWDSEYWELQFCDGTNWVTMNLLPAGSTPPTMPTYDGYIVLSKSQWDGNLGGAKGVRDKCLSDLTTYDWMGKATAVANGQLVDGKVEAMIWWQGWNCSDPQFHAVPNARYYFASADRPSVGGGYVITDSTGYWMPDTNTWTGANQFDGMFAYWVGNVGCSAANYGCGSYTNNSSAMLGTVGFTSSNYPQRGKAAYSQDQRTESYRWPSCDNAYRLICLVHP
jgi:type II secretory pathway pseudopilin PulG